MAKKTTREDYRVVVWPEFYAWRKDAGKSNCEDILTQIRRHVDGIKQSYIDFTEKTFCEFCGSNWEGDNPVCCDKAWEEWNKPQNVEVEEQK